LTWITLIDVHQASLTAALGVLKHDFSQGTTAGCVYPEARIAQWRQSWPPTSLRDCARPYTRGNVNGSRSAAGER
jgi:hypothetical protein